MCVIMYVRDDENMSLYETIKNNINVEGLNKLEISRLLYIELCKIVSFSTKFQNTDTEGYIQLYRRKVDIDTFDEQEVNCVIFTQLYSQLLTRFNIDNEIINQGHWFVRFKPYDNDEIWIADATEGGYSDLSRIHNGDDTEFFGPSLFKNEEVVTNRVLYSSEVIELLRKIDIKIGYNDEKHKDLEEFKKIIEEIKSGKFDINYYVKDSYGAGNIEKKLGFLFAKLGVLDFGYYEAKDYIYYLESLMLTKDELENVSAVELKRTNPDGDVDIVQVISLYENNKYHYYIVSPKLPIKEVSQEDIIRFSMLGYGTDDEKTIPGFIYPRNFKYGKVPNKIKFKLQQQIIPIFIMDESLRKYADSKKVSK